LGTVAIGFIWSRMRTPNIVPLNPALRGTGCYGWTRTGFMTKEENTTYSKLEEACSKRDIKTMNDILNLDNRVHISCVPAKKQFIEPETPVIDIIISNKSDRPIHVLESFLKRYNFRSYNDNHVWNDDFDFGPNEMAEGPRYLKTLHPQASISFRRELYVEGYGKHQINLSYSAGVPNKLSATKTIIEGAVIDRTSCEFSWDEN
jgi:hypothetical protein